MCGQTDRHKIPGHVWTDRQKIPGHVWTDRHKNPGHLGHRDTENADKYMCGQTDTKILDIWDTGTLKMQKKKWVKKEEK